MRNPLLHRIKEEFLWHYNYIKLPSPKVKSKVPNTPQTRKEIIKDLEKNGFNLVPLEIDAADYKQYMGKAGYKNFEDYYGGGRVKGFIEKTLEHYLAAKMLGLSKDDVYIDIASGESPAADVYHNLFGCKVYKQDITFPEGIHGNVIGGNSTSLPLEDGFATKMALHCSLEHFEEDSDIEFIKEAGRVLRKGGKLCILPLYLFVKYAIQTDPAVLSKYSFPVFEKEATIYCRKHWGNRFGRFYDVNHFVDRIKQNLNSLKLTIYVVQNEQDIDPACYVKFVALFEK